MATEANILLPVTKMALFHLVEKTSKGKFQFIDDKVTMKTYEYCDQCIPLCLHVAPASQAAQVEASGPLGHVIHANLRFSEPSASHLAWHLLP